MPFSVIFQDPPNKTQGDLVSEFEKLIKTRFWLDGIVIGALLERHEAAGFIIIKLLFMLYIFE